MELQDLNQFEYTGLALCVQKLAAVFDDASYLSIQDYRKQTQVARIDLESDALTAWLRRNVESETEITIFDQSSALAAVELWLKSSMLGQLRSNQRREFQVAAYTVKGGHRVLKHKVVVTGLDYEAPEEQEAEPPSQASPKLQIARPDLALAEGSGQRFLTGMGEIQGRMLEQNLSATQQTMQMMQEGYNSSLKALQEQLAEERRASRERDEEYRRENLGLRSQLKELLQAQADSTVTSQSQVIELAKLQVANRAVSEVASTVQGFMALKAGASMPPALQTLAQAISQNPALLAALQEPEVQALLQDQNLLTGLAEYLKAMAQQKKLMAAQANALPAEQGQASAGQGQTSSQSS